MIKKCLSCGENKDETEFHWARLSKGLRHARCKKCVSNYSKLYAEENKYKIKAKAKLANDKKREQRLNKTNPFVSLYKQCPDCKETMYYTKFGLKHNKNGNKLIKTRCNSCEYQRVKSTYDDLLGKAKERTNKNRLKDPETYRERIKAWKAANPDKVIKHKEEHKQKRMRQCIETADGTLTYDVMKRLFASAISCPYCKQKFSSAVEKSLDHIVPLSRGGGHSLGNVVVCCLPCNIKKSTMTLEEYVSKQNSTG